MVLTQNYSLPTYEELEQEEIPLSTAALKAGALHFGKSCEQVNNEFVLCRQELDDPRKCLKEGKDVTNCALSFFKKVKQSCFDEFQVYANCIDQSSGSFDITKCRNTQHVFDKCMSDKLGIQRPPYDYFSKPFVYDSVRPKPLPEEPLVFSGVPKKVDESEPKTPARYGGRVMDFTI
uniref:NADH dehydrogenase [ubiquinone] 1 alpha subcomplex subunit 8 n=2 Tax=Cacopsylla melanoneura TaxID=428564 RepID=A0A8D8XI91_9HEMI